MVPNISIFSNVSINMFESIQNTLLYKTDWKNTRYLWWLCKLEVQPNILSVHWFNLTKCKKQEKYMNFKINIASSSSVILLTVHCCLSKGLKPSELFLLWECGSHRNKWVDHTSSLQPGTKSMFPFRTPGTFTSCAMSAL